MSQADFYRGVEAAQQALGLARAADAARCAAVADALDGLVAVTEAAPLRACRDGCAHCCHHPVGVTLPEAMRLRAALCAMPAAQRADLHHRIATAAEATRGLSWAELSRLPCPLLDADARCTVYAARPLPCRAWTATDEARCAEPGPLGIAFDRQAFLLGLGAASALRGDGPEPRELRAALAAVLAADEAGVAAAFDGARLAGA